MWAILASGQSLKPEHVEQVRQARSDGRIKGVIAVSNVGIDLAPWADAMVSHDSKWWAHHTNANNFKGEKFCRNHWPRCKVFIPKPEQGCNSGYMAMQIARDIYKAKRIMLLGFDMHGTHYFGRYPDKIHPVSKKNVGLINTTEDRFKIHIDQFNSWKGCPVVNCNPDSALKKFPFMTVEDAVRWGNEA